jgi:membrane protease YdiL (CAAX protease family)
MPILFTNHRLGISLVLAPAIVGVILGTVFQLIPVALLGMIVSALLAWRAHGGGRRGWHELGFTTPVKWLRVLALGFAGAVVVHMLFATILSLVARFFGPPDLSAFAGIQGRPERLAVMLLIALVNGALAEEIVFRGFLQARLEQRLAPSAQSTMVALVLTALVFGAGHFYQGWTGVIGTFFAGLVFGTIRLLDRRRLWSAAAAHGIYDCSAMIIVYLVGIPGA